MSGTLEIAVDTQANRLIITKADDDILISAELLHLIATGNGHKDTSLTRNPRQLEISALGRTVAYGLGDYDPFNNCVEAHKVYDSKPDPYPFLPVEEQ